MKSLFAVLCLASALAFAQQPSSQSSSSQSSPSQSGDMQDMKGMDMKGMETSGNDMSKMSGQTPGEGGSDEANSGAMHSMEGHHMDMGPHMKMTTLRPMQPGDEERAQKVVVAARAVLEKYKDYHTALNDGFTIFHPEIPQKQYHFTSKRNAIEAQFKFDPDNPTSLLYEKDSDGYRIVGIMYTAPKRFTEDDLNQRIPLSIAQWHEHVNFCKAPLALIGEAIGPNAKFGFHGSITTEAECEAAGGTFIPLVFNWMVHVYPLEKDEAAIWSVERQHQHND
jgi:hypothetical protein